MHQHQLVYDFGRDWFVFGWISVAIALGLTAGGIWLIRTRHDRRLEWFPYCYLAFALASDIFILPHVIRAFITSRRALAEHRYVVVEGVVEHFWTSPPRTKGSGEHVDVGGRHYAHWDDQLTAGFHQSQSRGGPVSPGAQVRIADFHGTILRLEIRQ